jgi:fluoride ion exporter CrcB/FEX
VHEHQAISEMASKDFILFLTTGLLSSFTTFSAMVFELVESLQQGQWWFALSRIGIQLVLGIVAVVLGSGLANRLS